MSTKSFETNQDSLLNKPVHMHRHNSGWFDQLIGVDPGLNRLRTSLQAVITIALILIVESLFIKFTHALQISTPAGASKVALAKIAIANHDYLVIAILLGAVVGMISSFVVMDATATGQIKTTFVLPITLIPALAIGIVVGSHRTPALVLLAVVLAVGTYMRRFGPRGFASGMALFMGYFFGFFLQGSIKVGDLGWLSTEILIGTAVSLIVRFTLFYPRPEKQLDRIYKSFEARARTVILSALETFNENIDDKNGDKNIQRQLVRFNETALMVDAQLGDPSAVKEGSAAEAIHQRIFDIELALSNIARFVPVIKRLELPSIQLNEIQISLRAIVQNDLEKARSSAVTLKEQVRISGSETDGDDRTNIVIPHRFAESVIDLANALEQLNSSKTSSSEFKNFQPAVNLIGGWLPGSSLVSAEASKEGSGKGFHVRLAPYTRTAIQVGISVGAATAFGVLLSGQRFYWAVIAAFVTFTGANNASEQIRKAISRVAGTLIGIGIGSLIATAIGSDSILSIVVILASLLFGFYLVRVSYAFMVIAITIMVAQLYSQLGEFSNSLLLLRLEETAIGAAATIVVILVVLPLKTRHVLRVALRNHISALITLIEDSKDALLRDDEAPRNSLRIDSRKVDASFQTLVFTAQPLKRNMLGTIDQDIAKTIRLASASRNYGKNLITDIDSTTCLDEDMQPAIGRAIDTLVDSLNILENALTSDRNVTYTRSSALFDYAERHLGSHVGGVDPAQLAIRDFKLIDGSMAAIAEMAKLKISDFDISNVATKL